MGTFFIYIIKSAICLVFFYLFYKLLLSKDTFHRFNRIVLLSLLLLSFVVPVVSLFFHPKPAIGTIVPEPLLQTGIVAVVPASPVEPETDHSLIWLQLLLLVYLTGVAVCFFRQILSLVKMFKLMKGSRIHYHGKDYTLFVHDRTIAPFSWMKRIVISEKDLKENMEKILTHELAHIRLKHSWDLMVADLCLSFQWFNPASWLLKQELQSIHEFEADDVVLRQGIDAKQYQLLLIEKAVGTRLYSMANSFNHSSLKKRITMMLKEKSNPWARLKYLYVLPLTCVTVLAFARPEVSRMEKRSTQKIDESVALAKSGNGNLSVGKITEISGIHNLIGIKNDENLLAINDTKKPPVKSTVKFSAPVITPFQVSGTVVSSADKNPLSEVSIAELGADGRVINSAISKDDGSFALKAKSSANSLRFSHVGYKTVTLPAKGSMTVRMEEAAMQMDELVVVGYKNTAKKQEVTPESTGDVHTMVEQMPEYPGGTKALMQYLQQTVRYPTSALDKGSQGKVVCDFVITAEGKVTQVKVLRGVSPELDSEAMRVILNMPNWIPGKQNGKNCAVKYVLPISFKTN